jgi:hypothetical protein
MKKLQTMVADIGKLSIDIYSAIIELKRSSRLFRRPLTLNGVEIEDLLRVTEDDAKQRLFLHKFSSLAGELKMDTEFPQ